MNTILRKQFLAHVGQTSPEPMMIEVARAEGVFFYTPEGKRYYDLVAGVSVSNVGHANPRVVEAVQRQAADYMHIMVYGEMIERPQVRYAARPTPTAAAPRSPAPAAGRIWGMSSRVNALPTRIRATASTPSRSTSCLT